MAGTNPPYKVFAGFMFRVWAVYQVQKRIAMEGGLFLVRFNTGEERDRVLKAGLCFFDKRPVLMQPWQPDIQFDRENIDKLPIWIQLPQLDQQFWGAPSLSKIGSLIGRPLKTDKPTKERSVLGYARLLIEVKIGATLPDEVDIADEYGVLQKQKVIYEWNPVKCAHCKMFGHEEGRKKQQVRQVWRPVVRPATTPQECVVAEPPPPAPQTSSKQLVPDADGFIAPRSSAVRGNMFSQTSEHACSYCESI